VRHTMRATASHQIRKLFPEDLEDREAVSRTMLQTQRGLLRRACGNGVEPFAIVAIVQVGGKRYLRTTYCVFRITLAHGYTTFFSTIGRFSSTRVKLNEPRSSVV
jgi:hypothetical protein